MSRPRGGPGSNQHQLKPPVAPRAVTASAGAAVGAAADPLEAPDGVLHQGRWVHQDVTEALDADPARPVSVWFSADIADGTRTPRATAIAATGNDGTPVYDDYLDDDLAVQAGRWVEQSGLTPVRLGGREVEFRPDGSAVLVGASPDHRMVPAQT